MGARMKTSSQSDSGTSSILQPSAKERFAHALALLPELGEVETVIRASFNSDVPAMRNIPEYLLGLGGKRIRPVLTLLCTKALGAKVSDDVIDVAAGIELIHMATLMHDDIIDESPVRRTSPPLTRSTEPQRRCFQAIFSSPAPSGCAQSSTTRLLLQPNRPASSSSRGRRSSQRSTASTTRRTQASPSRSARQLRFSA